MKIQIGKAVFESAAKPSHLSAPPTMYTLVDDHSRHTRRTVIGEICAGEYAGIPVLVFVEAPPYENTLCVNVVRVDEDGELHLTTCSTDTWTGEDLREFRQWGALQRYTLVSRIRIDSVAQMREACKL